jgi:hypothetical protein
MIPTAIEVRVVRARNPHDVIDDRRLYFLPFGVAPAVVRQASL